MHPFDQHKMKLHFLNIFYSILLLIKWVHSFSNMLPYVKFPEESGARFCYSP